MEDDGIFFPLSCWEAGTYFSSDADWIVLNGVGQAVEYWLRGGASIFPAKVTSQGVIRNEMVGAPMNPNPERNVRPAVWIK